jgi:hypothetical protein
MPCCKKARQLRVKRLKEQNQMKLLVKNPNWQAVRKSLVGKWRTKPDWACDQLKQFVGQISTASDDKIRIAVHYLTAKAFTSGQIKHPCISSLRTQLSMEIRKRKTKK